MIRKIIGGASFILGLLIVISFPWIAKFQPQPMSNAGILIGLILLGIGLYLLFS